MKVRLSNGEEIPIEMHKIRIVQSVRLIPASDRLKAIEKAGYNTFLLRSRDIFIDLLTDSGTNAMSDNQLGAMMVADDAYAGGESFYKLAEAVKDILGFDYVLPTHQGRAAEHLIAKVFIKPGDIIPMNYHFTTTKAHFELAGGEVVEIYTDEALKVKSDYLFKGNIDIDKLRELIKKHGSEKIPLVRIEATTNLIGGQPFSLDNLKELRKVCDEHNILLVMDGTLIAENSYLLQQRIEEFKNRSIAEIVKETARYPDILYISGRKDSSSKGGIIATNRKDLYEKIKPWLPLYEGFLTYGGMSNREVEAMAVGLREMVDPAVAGSTIEQIRYFVTKVDKMGIPVVTPPGGLACHIDAIQFLPHVSRTEYPAGALVAALYIASGVRAMERGTISMDRDKEGNEVFADLELARLAIPRRVYTISHIDYTIDRIGWLYNHRDLIKGLKFVEEPPVLRFFFGTLEPLENWGKKLCEAFQSDFGPEL
ncbi:tryptophanase [candidate division WOR-3 bacterium]|uniref:Tryptophanase n=1 Tax=candidate division WOR-3 bacterium TaxID=2052148 RepID=A0A660SEC9_UNCW3|nr:MAG: tryptophanase [candidate division WOR-3 bacterium]